MQGAERKAALKETGVQRDCEHPLASTVNVSDTAVGFSESREDMAFESPRNSKSRNLIPLPILSILYVTHQAAASRKPSFTPSDGAKLPCGQTFSKMGDDS